MKKVFTIGIATGAIWVLWQIRDVFTGLMTGVAEQNAGNTYWGFSTVLGWGGLFVVIVIGLCLAIGALKK